MPPFYLIGAAAAKAGVAPGTVRDYCRRGLLEPLRDSAGRRLFTETDITRVRRIYEDHMARCRPVARDRSRISGHVSGSPLDLGTD